MISVVIPLYNKEKQIARTLRSVLAQTYQDFEVVIVDDGSTDGSAGEVGKFSDPRIRLVSQKNAGVSAARNRGIEEARGEHVAFLDADDEWKADYLATQHSLAEKYPGCDVFATDYEFCDVKGRTTPTIIRRLPFGGEDGELTNYFEVASCSHPPIWTSAVMARKTALQSVGGFPVGVKSGEDLLTWARLAARYGIAYSRKSLAFYNIRLTHSIDRRAMNKVQKADSVGKELEKLYRQNESIESIPKYVSRWHEIRATDAMRNCQRLITWKESFLALSYNIKNIKMYAILMLSVLPEFLMHWILKFKAKKHD